MQHEDTLAKHLFGSLVFGALLALGYFLASPLNPVAPYHLLGFYGHFFDAFIFIGILLIARTVLPGIGVASSATICFLLLLHISTGEHRTTLAAIASHDHPPGWLNVFSTVLPAVLIDFFYKRFHHALLGGIINFIASGMFFYTARLFFKPEFQYSIQEATVATIAAVIAGVIGGLFVEIFSKTSMKYGRG